MHQNAEMGLKLGVEIDEIFQNREQNIEHAALSIAAHRMRFRDIAGRLESLGHTMRCCTPVMVHPKEAAMPQNCVRCTAIES